MILHKIIGSILTIAASVGIGCSYTENLNQHLKDLETLQKIYYMVLNEIHYNYISFQTIFEKISGKFAGCFQEWLITLSRQLQEKEGRSFEEIWNASIDKVLTDSHLKAEDLEKMKEAGKNILYSENAELCMKELEYQIKELRESYKAKKRVCRTLGIMGGIFLVIILI